MGSSECVSSGDMPKKNGLMLADWSSEAIFSFSHLSSSEDIKSAREMSGIMLVRGDMRRRYSMSTGLTSITISALLEKCVMKDVLCVNM